MKLRTCISIKNLGATKPLPFWIKSVLSWSQILNTQSVLYTWTHGSVKQACAGVPVGRIVKKRKVVKMMHGHLAKFK